MSESAIFTAIPVGLSPDRRQLRVTVFITPRLVPKEPREPLRSGSFPAIERWPEVLGKDDFVLEFDGGTRLRAVRDPASPVPHAKLWDVLFGETMVGDGSFQDHADDLVVSYPADAAARILEALYRDVAHQAGSGFPGIRKEPLLSLRAEAAEARKIYAGLRNPTHPQTHVEKEVPPGPAQYLRKFPGGHRFLNFDDPRGILAPNYPARGIPLAAVSNFYDRRIARAYPAAVDPDTGKPVEPEPATEPDLEFHGFVSFCADYPALLRYLGLAIDLLADIPDGPAAFAREVGEYGLVRVEPGETSPDLEALLAPERARPWLNFHVGEDTWSASSGARAREADALASDVRDGALRVGRQIRIREQDHDAYTLLQTDPDGGTLKLLELLANLDRVDAGAGKSGPSMTPDAASLPALRSVGLSLARHARAGQLVDRFDKGAAAQKAHDTSAPGQDAVELDVDDVTRGWRVDVMDIDAHPGEWFSLHARCGSYEVGPVVGERTPLGELGVDVGPDEGCLKAVSTTGVPGEDGIHYLHEIVAGWDGWSLAVPRPGLHVKENGPVVPEEAPQGQDKPRDFPLVTSFVPQPGTLPRLRFGRNYTFRVRAVDLAGNSLPEDQLRGAEATAVQAYQRWEPVPSPAVVPLAPFTEGESLLRMVIRSTLGMSAQEYCQWDKALSLPGHGPGDQPYLPVNRRHLAAPIASQQLAETHGMFDSAVGAGSPAAARAEQFTVSSLEAGTFAGADELGPGEYLIHAANQLALPYLPDPLSRGVAFSELPHQAGPVTLRWPAGQQWYERRPLRLDIVEGTDAPGWDPEARVLTVSLQQAQMLTVKLSSFLDDADLTLMRVWQLMDPAPQANLHDGAVAGQHWMLTPFEELTLVHAVEKPLKEPVILPVLSPADRPPGATYAPLFGTVDSDAASTGRLDVDASWEDPVDHGPDGKEFVPGYAHVGEIEIDATEDICVLGTAGAAPGKPVHTLRHEFRDTKHRYVNYKATATTRFREYFPPEVAQDPDRTTWQQDTPTELDIPSSRRPDPPDLRYIIPTWTWTEDTGDGGARVRTRSGGGLRIYLNRPWWSSGPDELLGVVVARQPWFSYPFDLRAGLDVPRADKALADDAAARLIDSGAVQASGRSTASPAERIATLFSPVRQLAPSFPAATGTAGTVKAHAAAATPLVRLDTVAFEQALPAALAGLLAPTSEQAKRFISSWGRDPVYVGEPVPGGPYIHQFGLRCGLAAEVSLAEVPGQTVTVVGHQPEYDPERQLWFVDVQLDSGSAYTPMVQLSLVRYQPHSVPGAEISAVVLADFAQLLPPRQAVVTYVEGSFMVTVHGPVGVTDRGASWQRLADQVKASRFVQAQLERCPANDVGGLAWVPVGPATALDVMDGSSLADTTWFARVAAQTPGPDRWRLVVSEYEMFATDESERDNPRTIISRGPLKYRLVYSDVFAL